MDKLEKVIAGLECCTERRCTKCPYLEQEMYCMTVLEKDALRILKMWDVIHKDIWDRTHEVVRLKKELKAVRAELDAALEKLSWLSESGKPVPEFPKEGM